MDPRTGLGRIHNFRVANYQMMMNLIGYCTQYTIDEVLQLPDVKERVGVYLRYENKFKEQLRQCTRVHGNLALLDLRPESTIYPGNRFMIYALFPDCTLSLHTMWGKQNQNVVFAVGTSIFNRTSTLNNGELMLKYGGGGHEAAGTCQIDADQADGVLQELIQILSA